MLLNSLTQLTDQDRELIKKDTGKTLEAMLVFKEATVHVIKEYKLILIFAWQGEYMKASVYQAASFTMLRGTSLSSKNVPVYNGRRHFHVKEDVTEYIDEERLTYFSERDREAFFYVCELIRTFEIEVKAANRYHCTWETEDRIENSLL